MIPRGCVESCPGCRHRALSRDESARQKTAWASAMLAPWAGVIAPLRAPERRWGYRRKALLHAQRAPGGWALGLLRRRGREKELIPIPDCPLHAPALNERLQVLRSLLPAELPLAFAQVTGAILTLVLKCHPEERWREWARSAEGGLGAAGVASLQLNWNPSAGRRALSSRHQETVWGPSLVTDEGFLHGAQSFRQQIPELENAALALAEEFLAEARIPHAVDLFSGAGASLRRWLARGWECAGVELVGEACRAAGLNAPGARVYKGKVEQRLPQLDELLAGKAFVLYTNPPRDGHAPEALAWIARALPARIAYLSCNPKTLARDLHGLAPFYRVRLLQPFDFFPQTDHVETLALLERR